MLALIRRGASGVTVPLLRADDLGAAMYPPQDEGEIRAATGRISAAASVIRSQAQRSEGDVDIIRACDAVGP